MQSIADKIYDHVFGSSNPTGRLIEDGCFPDDWTMIYLSLLEQASSEWKDQLMWPSKMVAAIHFTSWYLVLRYEVWQTSSGKRDEKTERQLNSLRSPSEIFLMTGSLAHETEVK